MSKLSRLWLRIQGRLRPRHKTARKIRILKHYMEAIKADREQGMTLQLIADQYGVSRQAIQEQLVKHYGTTRLSKFPYRVQVAKRLGCGAATLEKLERQELLKPIHYGGFYVYTDEVVEKARLLLTRQCSLCGTAISGHSLKYCRECGLKVKRYRYPFMSAEEKEKQCEATADWRKRNPERAKLIRGKAVKAYNQRQQDAKLKEFALAHPLHDNPNDAN